MEDLHHVLKPQKYRKIKFRVTRTQHLLIRAQINGIKGDFILDTGASNSCVDFSGVSVFGLTAGHSATKAAGAGATGMFTQLAKSNKLQIGSWKNTDFHVVIFDLSHVNQALVEHKAKPVAGIIGADVLMSGKAIIDYYNHCLYLK